MMYGGFMLLCGFILPIPVVKAWDRQRILIGSSAGGRPLGSNVPTVVVVTATWRNDNIAIETRAYLYSLLRWEKGPLRLVFLTTKSEMREISYWFVGCNRKAPLAIEFVELNASFVRSAIASLGIVGHTPLDHHSGVAGSAKVFLPELLPNLKRVVLFDVDVILNRPVSELWAEFEHFGPKQLFAATRTGNRTWNRKMQRDTPHAVCTCLLLLDLNQMRKVGWRANHPWLVSQFEKQMIDTEDPTKSDQSCYSRVNKNYPKLVRIAPQDWMLSKCQRYFGRRPTGVAGMPKRLGRDKWAALHFNCWHAADEASQAGRIRDYYYTIAARSKRGLVCESDNQPTADSQSDGGL
jgi:hypothetical protein